MASVEPVLLALLVLEPSLAKEWGVSAGVRGRWRSVPRSVEGTRGSERGGFILECSIDNIIPPIATFSYICAFAKFLEGVSSSGETHRQRCGLSKDDTMGNYHIHPHSHSITIPILLLTSSCDGLVDDAITTDLHRR